MGYVREWGIVWIMNNSRLPFFIKKNGPFLMNNIGNLVGRNMMKKIEIRKKILNRGFSTDCIYFSGPTGRGYCSHCVPVELYSVSYDTPG